MKGEPRLRCSAPRNSAISNRCLTNGKHGSERTRSTEDSVYRSRSALTRIAAELTTPNAAHVWVCANGCTQCGVCLPCANGCARQHATCAFEISKDFSQKMRFNTCANTATGLRFTHSSCSSYPYFNHPPAIAAVKPGRSVGMKCRPGRAICGRRISCNRAFFHDSIVKAALGNLGGFFRFWSRGSTLEGDSRSKREVRCD